ncbi:MAG: MFS transporter [Anaerolineae bacterium]
MPSRSVSTLLVGGWRLPATFAAMRHRNYRLWFFGQTVSLMGTWMQSVAQGWLVYQLTGSKLALGTISFFGTLPTLFLMLPGGAVVDRVPKRSLLLVTQTVMMILAFIMTILAVTSVLRVWHIAILASCLGVAQSFDAPARQALTVEMVEDRRDLMNAIALNSTIFNLARVIGPAVGGVVLASLGPAWCFGLNGLSFLSVIMALWRMRLRTAPVRFSHQPLATQVTTGLRYIREHPAIRTMILLTGFASLFGMAYVTLLPAFAVDVLHVGETGLGALNAAIGLGALVGSLAMASLSKFRRKGLFLTVGSLLFPSALILFSFSRSLPLSMLCLSLAGWSIVTQNATNNTLIQSICPDELRGRVMAVFSLMIFGTTPFGALQAGTVAQAFGPAIGVAAGAALVLFFAVAVHLTTPALRRLEA